MQKSDPDPIRYYPDLVSGKILEVKTSDIKQGNPIWHIGDTFPTFREAVLHLETCIQEDLLYNTRVMNEAASFIRMDERLLKQVPALKKKKQFRKKV